VYLFADATSPFEQVREILGEAHLYPAIGAVAALPAHQSGIRRGGEVDPQVLHLLAEGATHLIIGAYDGEGWLIWSRYP
jgi:hypothetical protein